MARFVFSLQPVLKQRSHVERQRQRDVASKQHLLNELQNELRALQERVRGATDELRRDRLIGTLDLGFLAAHRRFMLASQRQGMAIAQKIAAAQKAADDARTLLQEAAKQRKILEKLREKQLERWNIEEHRREMARQDEINVQFAFDNLADPGSERAL